MLSYFQGMKIAANRHKYLESREQIIGVGLNMIPCKLMPQKIPESDGGMSFNLKG